MRRALAVALALALLYPPVARAASPPPPPPTPAVTCVACLVVADDGTEIFARRAGERRAVASTTKMVTAMLVYRSAELDERVRVSVHAASFGLGGLDLAAGDTFTVEELLYALLLTSSNDAAVALAEHVAGSEGAFVDRMNGYVTDELGLSDTRFVTPHGLDRPGHHSSARDLARIGMALLEVPRLARIVGTDDIHIDGGLVLENRNLLLDSYPGAIGVKTGFTNMSGNVLVAAARREGRTVITVVLDSANSFVDSARLLDHGFAVLATGLVLGQGTPVAALVFDPAGAVGVVTVEDVYGLHDPAGVDVLFVPEPEIAVPIEAGDRVGVAHVIFRGRTVATVEAVASASVVISEGDVVAGWLEEVLATAARLVGRA